MKKLYTTTIEKDAVMNSIGELNYYYGEEFPHIFFKWGFSITFKAGDTLTIVYSDKNDVVKKVNNVFVNGVEVKKKRWWQSDITSEVTGTSVICPHCGEWQQHQSSHYCEGLQGNNWVD